MFTGTRTVSIADADSDGRMRFDAVARFLGDVANDDTDDAGFGGEGLAWVARRCTIRLDSFAQAREHLTMTTWCSGTGSRWAERRTSVVGSQGAKIEAAALWVHLDPVTGRPAPWDDRFAQTYLSAAGGRKVDSKLSLPKRPPEDRAEINHMPWRFRATDVDVLGHVNNAAYLAVLEEALGGASLTAPLVVTIEWQRPTLAGVALEVVEQISPGGSPGAVMLWILGSDGVCATLFAEQK